MEHEMKQIEATTSAIARSDAASEPPSPRGEDKDRDDLIRLGKRPVLLRNFGFMSILGFTCTVLITWEGLLIVLDIGLADGGPSAIIFGFLIVWIGATCIYSCLAELSSMAPTSGGQYHWVSMLAPEYCRKILSYVTGWLTVIGWQANVASSFYITASMIQGLARLNDPDAPKTAWQTVLIYWALVLYSLFINGVVSKLLPAFESTILIIHIIGFPAILLPMLFLADHAPSSAVFENFTNAGNLQTDGLAVLVGLTGVVYTLMGGDAAIHMAEEIRGASRIVPKSLLSGITLNGVLGFSMAIAVFFSVSDLDAAINSPTGYAFMEIFRQATGSDAGATVMVAVVLIMQLSCSVGLMAATSRMTWSFARDRGLPGWRMISRVDKRTSIPLISVLLTSLISVLLSLIILGSTTAFNNLVSISVVGLYGSYFIACSLLLYNRLTRGIQQGKRFETDVVNTTGAKLIWGPWRMYRWLGPVVNTWACLWAILVMFFSLWPTELPATANNMNYSVVVVGGSVLFAVVWYAIFGRREYDGPVIET